MTIINSRSYGKFLFITTIVVLGGLTSCMTAGTHGSIKSFQFSTTKALLQNAVQTVMRTYPDIYVDSSKNYIIDITNNRNDTIWDNHLNDGNAYVTINIKSQNIPEKHYQFIFQYVGDKNYWDTSKVSELSIAYAYGDLGGGGSDGSSGLSGDFGILKRKLIKVATNRFIVKIDSVLGKKHFNSE